MCRYHSMISWRHHCTRVFAEWPTKILYSRSKVVVKSSVVEIKQSSPRCDLSTVVSNQPIDVWTKLCVSQGNGIHIVESVVAAILPSRGGELLYLWISSYLRPSSNFVKGVLPFSSGLQSQRYLSYRMVKHMAMIMCADCAKWLCQIRRYSNLPPYVTIKMATTL